MWGSVSTVVIRTQAPTSQNTHAPSRGCLLLDVLDIQSPHYRQFDGRPQRSCTDEPTSFKL